ncbi:hypothetical protein A165_19695 [Vibrio tasmaniensis ZS-17]|nr:hypothetical protein A165_19695 [Vibrio tasmaniensis ZS-17]
MRIMRDVKDSSVPHKLCRTIMKRTAAPKTMVRSDVDINLKVLAVWYQKNFQVSIYQMSRNSSAVCSTIQTP